MRIYFIKYIFYFYYDNLKIDFKINYNIKAIIKLILINYI